MQDSQELVVFLQEVEGLLLSIPSSLEHLGGDLEGILLSVELLLSDIVQIEHLLPDGEALTTAVSYVLSDCQTAIDQEILRHRKGRPSLAISREQLILLLENHFSEVNIARMLQVSPRTICRRIVQYGLEQYTSFSDISDATLDQITESFVQSHPFSGRFSYQGFLRSTGLHIQQTRIRESLRRVDNTAMNRRFRVALHRRKYSVCMPNSLWHIDGYHKLIRWRIVIHGGIDGYSRLIVFLRAATNNTSSTVLDSFLQGVGYCGENVKVSEYMLAHPNRGPGRSSCITGRSVHNQRIERLWRDLYTQCASVFYMTFSSLEDEGLLDPNDSTDLYCLHYVFLPRLNHALETFQDSYNHHSLRTEGNKSPNQLWISGLAMNTGDEAAVTGLEESVNRVSYNK